MHAFIWDDSLIPIVPCFIGDSWLQAVTVKTSVATSAIPVIVRFNVLAQWLWYQPKPLMWFHAATRWQE